MPWQTTDGNHESDWANSGTIFNGTDSGGECGVPMRAQLPMPYPEPSASWYSVDMGPAHVVFISTEHAFAEGSAQHSWLAADLAAVDRSRTPWVVLTGHRPVYVSVVNATAPDGSTTVALELQKALEPLFEQFGVDLVLTGHHHSAQRTCPVLGQTCRPAGQAPVHCVVGNAGASLSINLIEPPPVWIAKQDASYYGFATIEMTPQTLTFTAYDNEDVAVQDSFVLHR
jgi:acid phosphatase type 7